MLIVLNDKYGDNFGASLLGGLKWCSKSNPPTVLILTAGLSMYHFLYIILILVGIFIVY